MDEEFGGLRMIKGKIHLNPGVLEPLNPYAIGNCSRRASNQIYLRAVNYDSELWF